MTGIPSASRSRRISQSSTHSTLLRSLARLQSRSSGRTSNSAQQPGAPSPIRLAMAITVNARARAGTPRGRPVDLLREGDCRAVRVAAEELTYRQSDHHLVATGRRIGQARPTRAVHPRPASDRIAGTQPLRGHTPRCTADHRQFGSFHRPPRPGAGAAAQADPMLHDKHPLACGNDAADS